MRYNTGDLAIVSAEVYDDGSRCPPSRRTPQSKKNNQNPEAAAGEEGPRKRAKVASPDTAEKEDDDKKRARGRPRLSTKDETSADRRRTQIRLAQRAYRSRKENAISTLEKKVQTLRDCNEEMKDAFLKLQEFALNHNLVNFAPDFGRQLQATSARFLALARQSEEDSGKDDEHETAPEHDSPELLTGASSVPGKTSAVDVQSQSPQVPPLGAYVVTHEPATRADLIIDTAGSFDAFVPTSQVHNIVDVALATADNASFPMGHFAGSGPAADLSDFSVPSPYSFLPPTWSHADQEVTFGRRLTRVVMQKGLMLLSMENPPISVLRQCFGWSLQYEDLASIKRRFEDCIVRGAQESLSHWQSPFHHLGGAGKHFDTSNNRHQRMGNEGTADVLRPRVSAGFAMGPFNEKISAASERLDSGFHMHLPGWEGEMMDPEEVERYLYAKGISFPPYTDRVVVEVDPTSFQESDNLSAQSLSADAVSHTTSSINDYSITAFSSLEATSAFSSVSQGSGPNGLSSISPGSSVDASTTLTAPSPVSSSDSWHLGGSGPLLGDAFSVAATNPYGATATTATTATAANFDLSSNPSNMIYAGTARTSAHGVRGGGGARTRLGLTRLVVDVAQFCDELSGRSRCLGRSPGFRKADINASFLLAATPC